MELSGLREGNKITLRCGGFIKIHDVKIREGTDYVDISLTPDGEFLTWFQDGNYMFSEGHPFDIVRIEE